MTGVRDALLIATTRYADEGLTALRAPFADATDLEQVLNDPELGDFRVLKLVDQPSTAVRRQLEVFFRDRAPTDLLVVYLSGHGLKDDDGNLHFAMTDTDRELLLSSAVPASLLSELMSRCRARQQVMLLDCCYSGAFARSLVAKGDTRVGVGETLAGRGRVVLTASDALQYSFEGEPLGDEAPRSVFTRAIVEGLRTGAADLDHDGTITPDELFDYACDRLRAEGRSQTPRKWALDVGGDIVLVRTGRPPAKAPAYAAAPAPTPLATKSAGPPPAPGRPGWVIPAVAAAAVALLVVVVLALSGGGGDGTPLPTVRIAGATTAKVNTPTCWTVEWTGVVNGTWSMPGFNMANPNWTPGDGFCATVTAPGSYTLTLRASAADGRVATDSLTVSAS